MSTNSVVEMYRRINSYEDLTDKAEEGILGHLKKSESGLSTSEALSRVNTDSKPYITYADEAPDEVIEEVRQRHANEIINDHDGDMRVENLGNWSEEFNNEDLPLKPQVYQFAAIDYQDIYLPEQAKIARLKVLREHGKEETARLTGVVPRTVGKWERNYDVDADESLNKQPRAESKNVRTEPRDGLRVSKNCLNNILSQVDDEELIDNILDDVVE